MKMHLFFNIFLIFTTINKLNLYIKKLIMLFVVIKMSNKKVKLRYKAHTVLEKKNQDSYSFANVISVCSFRIYHEVLFSTFFFYCQLP